MFETDDAPDGFQNDDPAKSRLKKEIDSWKPFADALRLEDRQLYRDMINRVWKYTAVVENSPDERTTETFLISLLISHQKIIDWLEEEVAKLKQKEEI